MKKAAIIIVLSLLFQSGKLSAQWVPSDNGITAGVIGSFLEGPGYLLAGGNGGQIYRSTDSGNSWQTSSSGLVQGEQVTSFGQGPLGIFAGTSNAIYYSNDDGNSWVQVYDLGGAVFSFAFLGDTILAATVNAGVIRSVNNGLTWVSSSSGITNPSIYSLLVKDGIVLAGTIESGVFISTDSGVNWTPSNTGISLPVVIRTLATDGNIIYAGTRYYQGPNIPAYGMYTSDDNGNSWQQVINGIATNISVFSILSTTIGTLATTGDVYLSVDAGQTWSEVMGGINTSCPYGLGGFLETEDYIFCGLEGGCSHQLYRMEKTSLSSGSDVQVFEAEVRIYPNPTTGNFVVSKHGGEEITQLELLDIQGRVIRVLDGKNRSEINLNLAGKPGAYFIRMQTDSGTIVKKVIKH